MAHYDVHQDAQSVMAELAECKMRMHLIVDEIDHANGSSTSEWMIRADYAGGIEITRKTDGFIHATVRIGVGGLTHVYTAAHLTSARSALMQALFAAGHDFGRGMRDTHWVARCLGIEAQYKQALEVGA